MWNLYFSRIIEKLKCNFLKNNFQGPSSDTNEDFKDIFQISLRDRNVDFFKNSFQDTETEIF